MTRTARIAATVLTAGMLLTPVASATAAVATPDKKFTVVVATPDKKFNAVDGSKWTATPDGKAKMATTTGIAFSW